jgi:hypothetical protein
MKLAEALQERKNLETEIDGLWNSLGANLHRAEDEDATADNDPEMILASLVAALDKSEKLTVAINNTNISMPVSDANFSHATIMEAIARRDSLKRRITGLQGTGQAGGRMAHFGRMRRTNKDEIKYVPRMDLSKIRDMSDKLSSELRRLDLDIQRLNWQIDLIE